MPRARDPNRDKAYEIWKQHNGEITNRAIAEQLNVPEKTISAWKSRDKWNAVLQNNECSTTNKSEVKKTRSKSKNKAEKEPVVESDELTDKQRNFCLYYLKYFNATKAYQKAYECSYLTANVNGSRLLVNASINAEIDRMKAEQASELKLDVKDVLQKYIDIAFADITDFTDFGSVEEPLLDEQGQELVDDDGNPLTYTRSFVNLKNANEVDGTIVTEVKKGKDGISVKLADKMKALEMLSKYFDLLSDHDKKKLQEEKLRMDIEKTKAEVEKINGSQSQMNLPTFIDDVGDTDD